MHGISNKNQKRGLFAGKLPAVILLTCYVAAFILPVGFIATHAADYCIAEPNYVCEHIYQTQKTLEQIGKGAAVFFISAYFLTVVIFIIKFCLFWIFPANLVDSKTRMNS